MNTGGIRDNLQKSYSPLSQNKQAKHAQTAPQVVQESNKKDSILQTDTKHKQTLSKIATSKVMQLNNINGMLNTSKKHVTQLITEVQHTLQNISQQDNDFTKLERKLFKTTTATYNESPIFNQKITLMSDEKEELSITMHIKKSPIENINDIYQLQTQTRKILKEINQIELKVDAKVDKKIKSMDYTDAKEKKETEYKRLEEHTNKKEAFKNISDSEFIQKELLWLLR